MTTAARWGLFFLVTTLAARIGHAAAPTPLRVGTGERLLVVAPHPDDETLAAGGLIQRVLMRGGAVRVVLVTAGDGYIEAVSHETGRPRPAEYLAYGERRLREARLALHELGGDVIRAEHLLGFPDGGLEPLLRAHWQHTRPERSSTTGAHEPPYGEAEYLDLRYDGADLRAALVRCLREFRPTTVALPDPLDRHPDHRASELFTLLAVNDWLRTKPRPPALRLLAYLIHWPNWPPGWDVLLPPSTTDRPPLDLPATLPPRDLARTAFALTGAEVATKARALDCYVTQQQEMPTLLAAFVRSTEPFTVLTDAVRTHVGEMIEQAVRQPPR